MLGIGLYNTKSKEWVSFLNTLNAGHNSSFGPPPTPELRHIEPFVAFKTAVLCTIICIIDDYHILYSDFGAINCEFKSVSMIGAVDISLLLQSVKLSCCPEAFMRAYYLCWHSRAAV